MENILSAEVTDFTTSQVAPAAEPIGPGETPADAQIVQEDNRLMAVRKQTDHGRPVNTEYHANAIKRQHAMTIRSLGEQASPVWAQEWERRQNLNAQAMEARLMTGINFGKFSMIN